MSDLIQGAIEWAESGIPVFPCGSNKAPLTANGFYDAVVDPLAVRPLFELYGGRATMVGARMGRESGLFAVDADLYKGDAPKEYIEKLMGRGLLPDTRMHRTKSGGLHMIYSSEESWPNLAPSVGIDIKGEGGYIIVPPTPGYEVLQEGLIAAPAGLIKELMVARDTSSLASVNDLKMRVLEGSDFHDALRTIAAKRSAAGWSPAQVLKELTETLTASVASNINHDRHSRWSSLLADSGKELSRIAKSGYEKYNPQYKEEKYKEQAAGEWADIAASSGMFDTPSGVERMKVREFHMKDGWPFEGEGYFATEEFDLLDQEFVAYPFLAEQEVTVIYAEPKKGKTAWNLTLAFHVACGRDFGSVTIPKARGCLYFALEGPRAIKLRIAALKKEFAENGWEVPDNLPLFVVEAPKNLMKEADRLSLRNQIKVADELCKERTGAALGYISFDTLTKAMSGGDQNSATDTALVFEMNGLIRESGVTANISYVHHKTKSTGGARGSSNIEAEADVMLDITKDGDIMTVRIARARSIEEGGKYDYRFKGHLLGITKQGLELHSVVVVPMDSDDASGSVGEAHDQARAKKAIVELGDGLHDETAIREALEKIGVKIPKPARGVRGVNGFDRYVVDLIGSTGTFHDGASLQPKKDRAGTVVGVAVG